MEQYDKYGRMKYNPEYHDDHGNKWSEDDLIYLCSIHGTIPRKSLSMALGRTETAVSTKLYMLKNKQEGKYKYYRNLGKAI